MKKIFALLLLFVGTFAFAQTSNVTATVVDSDSQAWNNGQYQIAFVAPSGYTSGVYTLNGAPWTPPATIKGSLSSSGVLTYNGLPRNDYILPTGSHWLFNVCPNASFHCSATTIGITTASQNISSTLVLSAPRFAAGNVYLGSYGYNDAEISPTPITGQSYYDVTLNCQKTYNGSTFACPSSGSGGITALTDDVTASGTGSVVATLKTVNSAPGTCGDSTHVCQFTDNGKGLVISQTPISIVSSGGSSIVSGIPAIYLTSSLGGDDSGNTLGAVVTATAQSCTSGGLCTITAPQSYVAGQWVNMGGAWKCPGASNSLESIKGYAGTGIDVFQVLSSSLSGTQFEIQTPCGVGTTSVSTPIEDATYFLSTRIFSQAPLTGASSVAYRGSLDITSAYGGQAFMVAEADINFTTVFADVIGSPFIVFADAGIDDYCVAGQHDVDIEGHYQSLWAKVHAAGGKVVQGTIPFYSGCSGYVQPANVNTWFLAQGKTVSNVASGRYWDYIGIDSAPFGALVNPLTNAADIAPVWVAAINSPGTAGNLLQPCNVFTGCGNLNVANTWIPGQTFNAGYAVKNIFTGDLNGNLLFFSDNDGGEMYNILSQYYTSFGNGGKFESIFIDGFLGNPSRKYWSDFRLCWSGSTHSRGGEALPDTCISRTNAKVFAFGSSTLGDGSGTIFAASFLPGVIYSAAGTALPTCAAGLKGQKSTVSDATSPLLYMTAYTSGGTLTADVMCSYDGSTYTWLMH